MNRLYNFSMYVGKNKMTIERFVLWYNHLAFSKQGIEREVKRVKLLREVRRPKKGKGR